MVVVHFPIDPGKAFVCTNPKIVVFVYMDRPDIVVWKRFIQERNVAKCSEVLGEWGMHANSRVCAKPNGAILTELDTQNFVIGYTVQVFWGMHIASDMSS